MEFLARSSHDLVPLFAACGPFIGRVCGPFISRSSSRFASPVGCSVRAGRSTVVTAWPDEGSGAVAPGPDVRGFEAIM